MNQPELDGKGGQGPEDQPLDPATLRVQTRLKRLLAGSSLVMFAGFIAVFAAIFYKINYSDGSAPKGTIASSIAISPKAVVEDIELVDGRLVVLIREGDATALLHFDTATGSLLGRTNLVSR
ncbi:hypothetical protein [Labrenzia sp. CE80]|uniref:hypothetical protein n=1 Tax=Labrenzia sp. CE80 TaxID=1788986 RepID=UPI00129A6E4C|nr:hypothetical protein [Labrenzia sp. CE80]